MMLVLLVAALPCLTLVLAAQVNHEDLSSPDQLIRSQGSNSSPGQAQVNHEDLSSPDKPIRSDSSPGQDNVRYIHNPARVIINITHPMCLEKEKKKCTKRGGTCQRHGTYCPGKVKPRYCVGHRCSCCIPCKEKKRKCREKGGICKTKDMPCLGARLDAHCKGDCTCCVPLIIPIDAKCIGQGGFCAKTGDHCCGKISILRNANNDQCTCCIPELSSGCPIICTYEHAPVCGSDGKIFKTYPNKCNLQAAVQCDPDSANMKWQHNGKCKCPIFCTKELVPVCGSDGKIFKTYPNKCVLRSAVQCDPDYANMKWQHNGKCKVHAVPIVKIIDSTRPHHKGGGPGKAIDGNLGTYWNPNTTHNYNKWFITFELAKKYTVTGVKLHSYGDHIHDITEFKLESSDVHKKKWSFVGSKKVTPGLNIWQSFDGFKAVGKYLRFTVTHTKTGWQPYIREIRFTGYTGDEPPVVLTEKPKLIYTGGIHCCDVNKDKFKDPGCSRNVCNQPQKENRYSICRNVNKKGYFFTTKECYACTCIGVRSGALYPSCHQSVCPGSPRYRPHYKCETIIRDMGELGCCIDYVCKDTTCIVKFKNSKMYLGVDEKKVDPADPCTTCTCEQKDCKTPPTVYCTKALCARHKDPKCRPIKYSKDCCARRWDCTNSYLLMTPKRWAAGGQADICVLTPSGDNVNVTLEVQLDAKGYTSKDHLLFSGKSIICTVLSIDQTVPPKNHRLTVRGKIGKLSISETRNIRVVNIAKTWVQTDKFLYKPDQLVQFRILTVWGPQFQVAYDKIPEVHLTSPTGSRIAQWLNVKNPQGIVHLNYSLPEEPEKGLYTIQVRFSNKKTKLNFKVEPYTLPKFTVTITPPAYVLATDMEAKFKICASYTFGEPVKGYLNYKARPNYRRPFFIDKKPELYLKYPPKVPYKPPNFNGCQEVTITPKDIGAMTSSFTVEATVKEEGTGISAKAEHKMEVKSTWLHFEKISKEKYYKFGLPTTLQVLVTKPDKKPIANYVLNVCVMKDICSNISTDSAGILSVVLPVRLYKIKNQRQIPVFIKCDASYKPSDQKGFNYAKPSSKSFNFPRFFSPSGSYLSIKSTLARGDCRSGRTIVTDVIYVTGAATTTKMWIILISSGRIISKTQHQVKLVSSSTHVKKSEMIGRDLGTAKDSLVKGSAKLTVKLPNSISNLVKVLAFYIRKDSEVVAASTSLDVTVCQRNPTALSWIPSYRQEPGQLVNVNLKAHSGSICSLGVVDRSVELLSQEQSKTGKLSLETLVSLLKELEPFDWEVQSNDHSHCTGPAKRPILEKRKKREANIRQKRTVIRPPWGPYTEEKDAITAFDDAGVFVLSDFTIETRPCINRNYEIAYATKENLIKPMAMDSEDFVGGGAPDEEGRQREYFPETWLWKILLVPDNGKWQERLALPDTITEWVGQGVCVHPKAGLGVSNVASVVTFTKFFLQLTIPPTIKCGEAVTLKISVFNYLKKDINVAVVLTGTGSYSILSPKDGKESLSIAPKSKSVTTMVIRALVAGDVKLTVTACVDPNKLKNCGGKGTQGNKWDTVVREIHVKWEGVEKQITKSGYLCEGDFANWQFIVPNNIVKGSARGFINVAADLLGPTVENLDHLVRMPYGCGEQNMLGFTPNIFVLKYLSSAGLATAVITHRATENMEAGYKRELQYRHDDGSYSAFGSRDSSGSTWLTAFVLKSFAKAKPFITVDKTDCIKSQKWLESKQKSDGCFDLVGRVIHKDMKGGLGGKVSDSLAPLTSYVLISLLEADMGTTEDIITKAKSCINHATKKTFYTEALRAYALALNADDNAKGVIISAYTKVISAEDSPGISASVVIEAMSYVLLAMLSYQRDSHLVRISNLVRDITKYSNGEGGFVSTQDTVVALQALAKYSELFQSSKNSTLAVDVSRGKDRWNFNVDASNRLLVQMKTMAVKDTVYNVSVKATGQGCALVSSILRYNIPSYGDIEAFSVHISTKPLGTAFTNCSIAIDVCAKYVLPDESNMAIMEIDLTTGFKPDETINNLFVKRYEVDDGRVTLYFDSITKDTICINFKAIKEQHVKDAKQATLTLTDYYDPQLTISKNFAMEVGGHCRI